MNHRNQHLPILRAAAMATLVASGLAAMAPAAAAPEGDSGLCGITTTVRADGAVELSNVGNTQKCDTPVPAAAPTAVPFAAPGRSAAATAAAPTGPSIRDAQPPVRGDSGVDPRQKYREAMLQGAPGTTGANPAVSRRYKMMDRATYQSKVVEGASQD